MSKILIVEDEESIAELEKDYLELSGFEVEIENNGTDGLDRALKEDYDLLILDLMLPGTDGFEICRRVWFLPKRRTLTKSAVWALEQMIILQSRSVPARWLPE